MATARADARYRISADDQTRAAIQSARRGFQSLQKEVAGLGLSFRGLVGATGFGLALRQSLDFGNKLQDLSARLGVSVESLSRFAFAAQSTGVNFQTAATAIQRLQRRTQEAVAGNQNLRNAFRELGIDLRGFAGADFETRIRALAEGLDRAGKTGNDLRLAMALLDTEGVALLQTFRGGADAYDELSRAAEDARAVVGEKFTKGATDANFATLQLKAQFSAIVNQITEDLAPALRGIAGLGQVVSGAFNAARQGALQLADGIAASAAALVQVAQGEFTVAGNILRNFFDNAAGRREEVIRSFEQIGRGFDRIANGGETATRRIADSFSALSEQAKATLLTQPVGQSWLDREIDKVEKLASAFRRYVKEQRDALSQEGQQVDLSLTALPRRSPELSRLDSFDRDLARFEKALDQRRTQELLREIRDAINGQSSVAVLG